MSKIFKDGHVSPEVINPNYRGLVGWRTVAGEVVIAITPSVIDENGEVVELAAVLSNGTDTLLDWVTFQQFTPSDIPEGETCWVSMDGEEWERMEAVFPGNGSQIQFIKNYNRRGRAETLCYRNYFVPTLIAETAEEAEARKDWSRE